MPGQASTGTRTIEIFFSSVPAGKYREHDYQLREQLENGLSALGRRGLISIWHEGKLRGGTLHQAEIAKRLKAAEIILLLLSPEFVQDDFCHTQMVDALARYDKGEALVVPVLLRRIVGAESLHFSDLKTLPEDENLYPFEQNEELWRSKVAEGLYSIIKNQYSPLPSLADPAYTRQCAYRDTRIASPQTLSPTSLVARPKLLTEISRRLAQNDLTALVLTGLGGVGKSALAAQVYDLAAEQEGQGAFSGKSLWFHIDETVTLVDIVASLCNALGRPLPLVKGLADLPIQDLARELFQIIRSVPILIILDQFETWLDPQTGQARPEHTSVNQFLALLNTTSQVCAGRVLITSRFYPTGTLHSSWHVQEYKVAGMELAESLQLLRTDGSLSRELATDKELTLLAQRCHGYAQTLGWLCKLFQRDASLTLSALLHDPSYESWWTDPGTSAMLDSLYTQYLNTEQRELLQAFSVYREAVPLGAVLALAEPRSDRTTHWSAALLFPLLDLSLVQTPGNGLYRIHPVVADFVRTRFEKDDRPAWIEAHTRAAGYYQKQFGSSQLPEELEDLLALVEAAWHLCQAERRGQAYRLIQKTKLFATLHRQGSNARLLNLYLQLLAQQDWLSEPSLAAPLHNEMGEIRSSLGQTNEALHEYSQALDLFRQANQLEGIVEALNNLGAMYCWSKQYTVAQNCYQEALQICEKATARIAQKGTTLNNLGRLAFDQGKQEKQAGSAKKAHVYYHEALTSYEQALAWNQDNSGEEAHILNNIGEVYYALGDKDQARHHYLRALRSFRKFGNRRGEGMTLNSLGLLYKEQAGQGLSQIALKEARSSYEHALRIFREIGDLRQEITVLRNLGRFYIAYPKLEALERYKWCMACFVLARDISIENMPIPFWVEDTVRREIAKVGGQSYEEFLRDMEEHAEQIIEDILNRDQ